MPSAWDANANTNLLISINEIQNPKPPNWKDVAEKMKEKGYEGFTHEACRQHYQKLRKDAKSAANDNGSSSSTPAKKASAKKVSTTKPASKKRKVGNDSSDLGNDASENGDDEENFQTPTKKRKPTVKKEVVKKEVVKKWEGEDSEGSGSSTARGVLAKQKACDDSDYDFEF